MLTPTAPHRRRTPPQHSHHVLTHRRGGPRRSARFRYAARGGHLSFCLPCCCSTHYSSIGRRRVRHTTNHSLAHSADLRGRMIGIKHANEEPARRRRLSELLQWQLLMRGAPHISGTAGLLLPRPLLTWRFVVSSCVRGASVGQIPSGARSQQQHRLCAVSSHSPCLLVLHPLASAPPVTTLSCHQCLVSSAVSHVNGHPSPVG